MSLGKAVKATKTAATASASATTQAVGAGAAAAAEAAVPLTLDEKKALSDAISGLDDNGLTRVYGIILARMPLGSSEVDEIELEIDSMDLLTLRRLQGYIRELNERVRF